MDVSFNIIMHGFDVEKKGFSTQILWGLFLYIYRHKIIIRLSENIGRTKTIRHYNQQSTTLCANRWVSESKDFPSSVYKLCWLFTVNVCSTFGYCCTSKFHISRSDLSLYQIIGSDTYETRNPTLTWIGSLEMPKVDRVEEKISNVMFLKRIYFMYLFVNFISMSLWKISPACFIR